MEWTRYGNIVEFRSEVYDFLMSHEACNNLLVSLILRLSEQGVSNFKTPLMFAMKERGSVQICGFHTSPFNLLLPIASRPCYKALAHKLYEWSYHFEGVTGPSPGTQEFVEEWFRITGHSGQVQRRQVVYELQEINQELSVATGFMCLATMNEINRVTEWLLDFGEGSDIQGFEANYRLAKNLIQERRLFFWCDQEIIAMAAFGGETPHGSRINAVYTAPEFRGRGYATSLVKELSRILLGLGHKSCFLSTEKNKPSTRQLYEKIGYHEVCEMEEWRLSSSSDMTKLTTTL